MSRQFVDSFFPEIASTLASNPISKGIFVSFLPKELIIACPEVQIQAIRNPILGLNALIGIALGWWGIWKFSNTSARFWPQAYACFGLMNAVAIPLHCIFPMEDENISSSVATRQWLWIFDALLTGASSTAIVLAILHMAEKDGFGIPFPRNINACIRPWESVCGIGVAAAAAFLYDETLTLPLELWYIIPTNVAAVIAWLHMAFHSVSFGDNSARYSLITSSVAALVFGGAVVLESHTCRWLVGQHFLDAFRIPSITFMTSDVLFFCLFNYILSWLRRTSETMTG